MDCQTALETLDCARPNGADNNDTHFADAIAHTRTCQPCGAMYEQIQKLDIAIGRAITDVAVPDELKARILSRLNGDGPAEDSPNDLDSVVAGPTPAASVAARPSRWQRARRWFYVAASVVVVLAAAWQFWPPANPQFTIEYLRKNSLPEEFRQFDANLFNTRLPSGWANHRSLDIAPGPWGVDAFGPKDHDIAGFNLDFYMTRHREFRCHLVIVPKEYCQANAAMGAFSSADVVYVKIRGTQFATVAWTEDDFVYVVFVRGGNLEALQRRLETRSA